MVLELETSDNKLESLSSELANMSFVNRAYLSLTEEQKTASAPFVEAIIKEFQLENEPAENEDDLHYLEKQG
jgi:hypothetical protein